MKRWRFLLEFTAAWLFYAATAASGYAQEYQLKSAFLYNFAKQVEWPAEAFGAADSPVAVCAFTGDPIGDALRGLDGKAANARKLSVKLLAQPGEAKLCHIVFFCDANGASLEKVQAAVAGAPILTVGEQASFVETGGVMALIKNNNNKIQLKINLKAAQQARLKLSPQLLKLAASE